MITLLSDFGTRDGYVGAMKGVIASIAPGEPVADIAHDVPPQDVAAGAFALRTAARWFPPGTVHCAVVDPGVGSARRALALRTARFLFVGPDNGLLAWAADSLGGALEAVSCTEPAYRLPEVSCTFHGRDVFAPVAAHLALGVPLSKLGERIGPASLVRLPWEETPLPSEGPVEAAVLHVDRFGNLVTSVPSRALPPAVLLGRRRVAVRRAYEGRPGALVAVPGSSGLLELSVVGGSAAEELGLGRGDRLRLRRG